MQNPFENGDNNEGPGGLPVPPNYATVTHTESGDLRIGKVGFSLTAFFFNLLVPIFRGDWYNFLCMAGIQMGVGLGVRSINLTASSAATVGAFLELGFGFLWGFIYNYMYFRHLFNRGYRPATQRSKDLLESRNYLPKWLK